MTAEGFRTPGSFLARDPREQHLRDVESAYLAFRRTMTKAFYGKAPDTEAAVLALTHFTERARSAVRYAQEVNK